MSKAQTLKASDATAPVAQQVVSAMQEALGERLVGVALFGSRARGDARPGSDWDFLVVAEGLPEGTLARHVFLKRILSSSCRALASLLAVKPDEFEACESSLYLDIALDSQELYDPHGCLQERLGRLKRRIRELGLHRERTLDGDVWRRKEQAETSLRGR